MWRRALAAFLLVLLSVPAMASAEMPAHYDLKARVDAPAGRISATLEVTLPGSGEEIAFILGDRFRLDRVDAGPGGSVNVTPSAAPVPHLNRILVRFGPRARTHRVSFVYSGSLNEGEGDAPALSPERVELNIETMWLPVRADLGMVFTVDAEIRGLPADLVVIPQGGFHRRGDRLTIHRGTAESDLLLAGAVGLKRIKGPDVDFYAAEPDDPLVAMLRKHAFGAAAFYRRLYGPPSPNPVRMVIVPRGNGAGYARRSFVVMPTFRKPGAPTPPFDESSPARFVSHEFRHAWKANIEGLDYDNYWLSESIAEYFALRYTEATLGIAERDAVLERKRKAMSNAGPLIGLGKKPTGAALYQKGPVLLFDLERRIGRPVLDRLLVRRDPTLTVADFLRELKSLAGAEVAATFEAALR
jgi:hypothetical protein